METKKLITKEKDVYSSPSIACLEFVFEGVIAASTNTYSTQGESFLGEDVLTLD